MVNESLCSSKQVQENVVHLIISCSLWHYEVKVFAWPCTSLWTKSNRLWKGKCWNKFRYSYIQCCFFFLWQHNYTLENHMFLEWLWLWVGFLRNLHLIKSKRSIFWSSCKFYRKLFLTTSFAAAVLHLYVFFSKCITVQSRFSNTRKMELFVTNVKS